MTTIAQKVATGIAAVAISGTAALAGGIDRSGQSITTIFEQTGENGSYVSFSYGIVSPKAGSPAMSDPLDTYSPYAFAYKQELSDALSLSLIFDQPFGANVNYSDGPFRPAPLVAAGITPGANISSSALTGILRYKLNDNFSVHGGLRVQELGGNIATSNGATGFRILSADSGYDVGGLVGVAYERPEIALRVSLTYNSAITHAMTGTETTISFVPPGFPLNFTTAFTTKMPDSWNLEFQTGIAPNTLLFGSARRVNWNGVNLTTPITGNYVNFAKDTTTYSIGLGRKFNDNWSGAVTYGWESEGTKPSNTALAPTTGEQRLGLGVTYTQGKTVVTAGVTYGKLGTQSFGPATWSDNNVVGAGIKLGFRF